MNMFGVSCNIVGDIKPLVYMLIIVTTVNVALLYWIYRKWRNFTSLEALRKRNSQVEMEQTLREDRLRMELEMAGANKHESEAESDNYEDQIDGNEERIEKPKLQRSWTYTKLDNTNIFSNDEACTKKLKRKKGRNELNGDNIDDVEVCAKKIKLSSQAESKHDDVNIKKNSRIDVAPNKSFIDTNVNIDLCGKRSKSLNARAEDQTGHGNADRNDNIAGRRKKYITLKARSEDDYYRANIGVSDVEPGNSNPLRKAASIESAIFKKVESDSSLSDLTSENDDPETLDYIEDTTEILNETFRRNEGVSRIPLPVTPRARVPRK